MARGDPVGWIGIVRYPDAVSGQLFSKAYRARTGRLQGLLQPGHPRRQLLRPVDRRLPEPLAARCIQGSEDLAAPAVEDGQRRRALVRLQDPPRQGVEGADAARRQPEADAEAAGRGDPDPQAGEGAGAEPDREQVDPLPSPCRGSRRLDLLEQAGRMQGPPLGGEPQLRLVQDLAVAPGAGDGVNRRGIEADDDQGRAIP